jgi:hypothetical protein
VKQTRHGRPSEKATVSAVRCRSDLTSCQARSPASRSLLFSARRFIQTPPPPPPRGGRPRAVGCTAGRAGAIGEAFTRRRALSARMTRAQMGLEDGLRKRRPRPRRKSAETDARFSRHSLGFKTSFFRATVLFWFCLKPDLSTFYQLYLSNLKVHQRPEYQIIIIWFMRQIFLLCTCVSVPLVCLSCDFA